MGRFKSKKKLNNTIIYVGLFILSISFSIKYLYKENLIKDETLVDILISDNFGNYKEDITDVDFLMKYLLDIDISKEEKVVDEESVIEKVEIVKENLELIPTVYIYNTHQEEKYQSTYLGEYNISSSVFVASKIFKEYLEDLDIGVIVEEANVTEKLRSLGWKYGSSYKVSRMFMETAYKKNNSLVYFVDLHRDSSSYSVTTTEINGEKYAKVLFVVGLDNVGYEANLALAESLNSKIKEFDSSLSRGVIQKSGKGVNGVYNQDFSPYVMLIEVGGQYNNIKEVNNTLKVLAKILAEYIKEDTNG